VQRVTHRLAASLGGSLFFMVLAVVSLAVFAAGPQLFPTLAYRRSSILQGQVWRLVTAHFVHANGTHLLWNLSATGIVAIAVPHALSLKGWMVSGLIVALGSTVGVLVLQPEVRVMVGLSALLHGLLAAGSVAGIRRGERVGWVFLGLLAVKVAWEQFAGPTPVTRALLGDEIAAGAHACGTIAGLFAGAFVRATSSRA
jgi:rhomboid family GlyGly-CTERM serine protease